MGQGGGCQDEDAALADDAACRKCRHGRAVRGGRCRAVERSRSGALDGCLRRRVRRQPDGGARAAFHPAIAAILAGIAIAWAAAIGVRVGGGDSYLHMFDAWEMKTPAIEEAREAIGLVIVAGWMLVIAATSRR